MKKFTYEPGREIHFDGQPCIGITREAAREVGERHLMPYQVDHLTRVIVKLLNKSAMAKKIASGASSIKDASR